MVRKLTCAEGGFALGTHLAGLGGLGSWLLGDACYVLSLSWGLLRRVIGGCWLDGAGGGGWHHSIGLLAEGSILFRVGEEGGAECLWYLLLLWSLCVFWLTLLGGRLRAGDDLVLSVELEWGVLEHGVHSLLASVVGTFAFARYGHHEASWPHGWLLV